jgi:predicted secreted hydrolase
LFRLRHIYIPILLSLISFSITIAQEWKNYPFTPEGSLISFPTDEGWHPDEDIEWWYIAGHLEGTTSGTPYSFMLTYFYFPVDTMGFSFDGFRILNVSNDQTGVFHSETMVLNFDSLATDQLFIDARLFNFVDEYWRHREEPAGTLLPFEYELSARAGENALSLTMVSQKPPLIPGDDGLFDQGAESYTYYYSLTENRVEGMLTFEGDSEGVSGTAWIDRQYGNFNPHSREKYEWFYLQLSNGMDLNIWNLFTTENIQPAHPAYKHVSVYVDSSRQYTTHDFALERLSWAKMPETENCYAQKWKLTSEQNQMDLTISTLHHNSEVEIPLNFFEGAVSATGTVNGVPVTGRGFAELLKTYEAPRLKITAPGKEWNENHPIRWELLNPDDGLPLFYDLSYSFDEGNTWLLIAGEISDTFYLWNDHPLVNGDSCLFKVFAYTADKTLKGADVTEWSCNYDDQYTGNKLQKETSSSQSEFRVYPNPVRETLWIDRGEMNVIYYRIRNLAGQLIKSGTSTDGSIPVGTLESGVYSLQLFSSVYLSTQHFFKE